MPAVLTGAWPHVHNPIGRAHRLFIVLDHQHGVAQVAHRDQRPNQACIVTLVQADGWLIQNIEHAHQLRTNLRCQADALRLAAG